MSVTDTTAKATLKANNSKDLNINDRISKFQNQLKDEYVYKIPIRYFTDLGKINFPVKIDFRIKCHLETEMKMLFESKKSSCFNSYNSYPRCQNNLYSGTLYSIQTTFSW